MNDLQRASAPAATAGDRRFDDEIDLAELAAKLWRRKAWIIACVGVAVLAAIAYLALAKPVYEATLFLKPPLPQHLVELNQPVFVDPERGREALLPVDVFEQFLLALQSKESLRLLGNAVIDLKITVTKGSINSVYSSIAKRDNSPIVYASVSLQGDEPEVADILNAFVTQASGNVAQQLADFREAELQTLKRETEQLILAMGMLNGSDSAGSQTLRQREYFLQQVEISAERIKPGLVDQAAAAPSKPAKPKQPLILAAAVLLGGMLGLFVALVVPMRKEGNQ